MTNLLSVLYIFFFFLSAFFPVSCAVPPEQPQPPLASDIAWNMQTPKQILDHLRHNQEKITDLVAAFSLSVDPPPEGQPSNMHGILFFSKKSAEQCVRIKVLGPFGRIVFDMVQEGNDLRIYIPSRKTLYQGQTDLKRQTRNVWKDMLETMFADYSKMTVPEGAVLIFKGDMAIVPTEDGTIMIDCRTGLVCERQDQKRTTTYNRYDQKTGRPPIPTHIEVKSTNNAIHAVCRLSQLRVNTSLSVDAFDLSSYNPENIRDLKELDMLTK